MLPPTCCSTLSMAYSSVADVYYFMIYRNGLYMMIKICFCVFANHSYIKNIYRTYYMYNACKEYVFSAPKAEQNRLDYKH